MGRISLENSSFNDQMPLKKSFACIWQGENIRPDFAEDNCCALTGAAKNELAKSIISAGVGEENIEVVEPIYDILAEEL